MTDRPGAGGTAAGPRGFTLIEVLVTLAVVLLLASAVLPSVQAHAAQARRADAVALLTKLEFAQGAYHAHHGRYTTDLVALGLGGGYSPQGHYRVTLETAGTDRYRAHADAVPGAAAADDRTCGPLTLDVTPAETLRGPKPGCWGRG